MRSTKEISEAIQKSESEIDRISNIIINDQDETNKPFYYKNGEFHPEWTFKEALTYYVAKKSTLKWVLGYA